MSRCAHIIDAFMHIIPTITVPNNIHAGCIAIQVIILAASNIDYIIATPDDILRNYSNALLFKIINIAIKKLKKFKTAPYITKIQKKTIKKLLKQFKKHAIVYHN